MSFLVHRLWKTALWIHHTQSNHRLVTIIGWVILISTALIWFGLAWVG